MPLNRKATTGVCLGILFLTGLIALGSHFTRPPEYDGRSLEAWLIALASLDYRERQEADRALRTLGPEAVPTLIRALTMRETTLVLAWRFVRERLPPPPSPRLPEARIRVQAARLLGSLGPAALPSVPALIDQLNDPESEVARAAAAALRRIGPLAVPRLIEALSHRDPGIRRAAVGLLSSRPDFGDDVIQSLPAVIRMLEDSDPRARAAAAEALEKLPARQTAAIEALERSLGDPSSTVRSAAASALGNLGSTADARAGKLEPLLTDPDGLVRVAAAKAHWQISGTTARSVPTLVSLLTDRDAHWRAALVLREIGPAAADLAVPALLERLQVEFVHRPSRTPASATLALARMGPAAVPGLTRLLEATDPTVRMGAAMALIDHRAGAASATPGLLKMLDDPDVEVRIVAAQTLGAIGPAAMEAVPSLRRIAAESRNYLQSSAENALTAILGSDARNEMPVRPE